MKTIKQSNPRNDLLGAVYDEIEPAGNAGDYILAAVGIVGVIVILILNLLGVA